MLKLNLLPSQEKKELKTAEMNQWFILFGGWLFFFLIIFILLCLSVYFYLSILVRAQNDLMEAQERHNKTQELAQFEKQIQEANQSVSQVYGLQKGLKSLTPVLEELVGLAPEGVSLTDFSYEKSFSRIELNGRALLREQFLIFQKKIEESPDFTDIDSPISNLLKQKDVDFVLSFKITQ